MRAVESQWWILELPDEWDAEQDEDTILVSDEDGVGEIAITTLQKESGQVTDAELKEYAEDITASYGGGKSVTVADLSGYYFQYHEEDDYVREWYLRTDHLLLLITYSCDAENAAMDDGVVDEILSTLFIKVDSPASDSTH